MTHSFESGSTVPEPLPPQAELEDMGTRMYTDAYKVMNHLIPGLDAHQSAAQGTESIQVDTFAAVEPDDEGARPFRDVHVPGLPLGEDDKSLLMSLDLDPRTLSIDIIWNTDAWKDLGTVHVEGLIPDVPKYQPPLFPRQNPEWQEPDPQNYGHIRETANILGSMVCWIEQQPAQ